MAAVPTHHSFLLHLTRGSSWFTGATYTPTCAYATSSLPDAHSTRVFRKGSKPGKGPAEHAGVRGIPCHARMCKCCNIKTWMIPRKQMPWVRQQRGREAALPSCPTEYNLLHFFLWFSQWHSPNHWFQAFVWYCQWKWGSRGICHWNTGREISATRQEHNLSLVLFFSFWPH